MMEYYMFNKPSGCITARTDPRHKTVMDFFPEEKRNELFPIGRLDKDTEGLLIVTNDGMLFRDLMLPERKVEKEYFFWARGELSENSRAELERGAAIYPHKEKLSAPASISLLSTSTLYEIRELLSPEEQKRARKKGETPVFSGLVKITEGKKHQVKHMLKYAGCEIVYLKRVSIGGLCLDEKLPKGSCRVLSEDELSILKRSGNQ